MSPKVIVITGGTGGIGYQEALALATADDKAHTIVVTGRSQGSAATAVASLQEASGNAKIHYALADLSLQTGVQALAKDLLQRFPVIDELINNAGNLSTGEFETTAEGVDKNIAVNVIAPLLLTRALVPALKAATPTGKVQITSGGAGLSLNVQDMEGKTKGIGIGAYDHSKRVMEVMTIALSKEMEKHGIVVNVVGGALPGATSMTSVIGFWDLPWFMKPFYPLFSLFMHRDDKGKSAKQCAAPAVWAALAKAEDLGTGKSYLAAPKEGKFSKDQTSEENQATVMKYLTSKLI